MDHASVEPPRSFSDATCDRLGRLALRGAALADSHTDPRGLSAELRCIQQADPAFARWQRGNFSDAGCSIHQVARRLVEDRSWLDQERGASDAAQRLLETASVIVRLQDLEVNFSRELDARKQEALYNFAYGLSHELNNPLANIATRAGVLAQDESSQQRLNLLRAIIDNAMRGCEMLGDLMLLARPPAITKTPTVLRELVDALAERTRLWIVGRTIELRVEQGFEGQLAIDPEAFSEALWGLIRNGIEAMPGGGRLTICTSQQKHTPDAPDSQAWCTIEISDEGAGLSAAALDHCFDPYYSGREAGRGLGLGLSKAQRLIDLHDGRLSIANRTAGVGCRVLVELPIGDG